MTSKDNTFNVKDSNESSGFLLWQVTSLWQQEIKKMLDAKFQITHSQFVVMASIHWLTLHNDEVTQISLSNHTKIEPMNVSQVLKALEKMSYISKKTHTTDTRAKAVTLTEEGKELIKNAIINVEEIDQLFFRKLNNKKQFNKELITLIG